MKKNYIFFVLLAIFASSCGKENQKEAENFRFAFLTDIHLHAKDSAVFAYRKAIDTLNKLNPDFVITGGDLIMDALGQTYAYSDSLYNLYIRETNAIIAPVYNTLGNHEVFGLYESSGVDPSHIEFGEQMYENRLGRKYYSFNKGGWHFIVLDGIGDTANRKYIGHIDSLQLEWLKSDVDTIPSQMPVCIITHIPMLSTWAHFYFGPMGAPSKSTVIVNGDEAMEILRSKNVKMVLQGHMHFLEDLYVGDIHYITGGAVSANWWKGNLGDLEEGFLIFNVKGEEFNWKYIEYGW